MMFTRTERDLQRNCFTTSTVGLLVVALAIAQSTSSAFAHPVEGVDEKPWLAWNWDPLLLLGAGIAVLWYGAGCLRMANRPRVWRHLAWGTGIAAILLALSPPINEASSQLFSAHMVQHLLLIYVGAPLLVISAFWKPFLIALPRPARRVIGRRLHPFLRVSSTAFAAPIVWTAGALVLWAWHIPGLYDLALESRTIHEAEHASLFLTAMLTWGMVLQVSRHYPARLLLVFATALQGSALGIVITFSQSAWYEAYSAGADWWPIGPLEDQRLGGLLMWLPGGPLYVFIGAAIFVTWLRAIEDGKQRKATREGTRLP